jgi:hypothetical protein
LIFSNWTGTAITATTPFNLHITKCIFWPALTTSSVTTGISLIKSDSCLINENSFVVNTVSTGISISGVTYAIQINSNNFFEMLYGAIFSGPINSGTIVGNVMSETQYAIYGSILLGVTITGNQFEQKYPAAGTTITLITGYENSITGNVFMKFLIGVSLDSNCLNNVITGNIFFKSHGADQNFIVDAGTGTEIGHNPERIG